MLDIVKKISGKTFGVVFIELIIMIQCLIYILTAFV